MEPRILETVVTESGVTLKLDDGVTVELSVNPGYLHLHFAGTAGSINAIRNYYDANPGLRLPNYLDIAYTTKQE
jgi:hypothetical protein